MGRSLHRRGRAWSWKIPFPCCFQEACTVCVAVISLHSEFDQFGQNDWKFQSTQKRRPNLCLWLNVKMEHFAERSRTCVFVLAERSDSEAASPTKPCRRDTKGKDTLRQLLAARVRLSISNSVTRTRDRVTTSVLLCAKNIINK